MFYFSAGPLCIGNHRDKDRRLDDDYVTFKKFNRSLSYTCESGKKQYRFMYIMIISTFNHTHLFVSFKNVDMN